MNQTFNFQRWSLLVAKHWGENRKRYLLSIAAFMGLLFMWYLFIGMSDPTDPYAPGLQHVTYYFSLLLVGPFYASQYFKDLGSRSKGINFLLTPASVFEKFLCSWLYALVLFLVVFTAAFYLVDAIVVSLANVLHPSYSMPLQGQGIMKKAEVTNVFNISSGGDNMSVYFLLTFLAIQSAALLGSIYFAQYSYIKTAIALCFLFIVVYVLSSWFQRNVMPPGHFQNGLIYYRVWGDEDTSKLVQLPKWVGGILGFLFQFGFPLVFWASTYFRLKEKEV
jgi:hypothetical protein